MSRSATHVAPRPSDSSIGRTTRNVPGGASAPPGPRRRAHAPRASRWRPPDANRNLLACQLTQLTRDSLEPIQGPPHHGHDAWLPGSRSRAIAHGLLDELGQRRPARQPAGRVGPNYCHGRIGSPSSTRARYNRPFTAPTLIWRNVCQAPSVHWSSGIRWIGGVGLAWGGAERVLDVGQSHMRGLAPQVPGCVAD